MVQEFRLTFPMAKEKHHDSSLPGIFENFRSLHCDWQRLRAVTQESFSVLNSH
uniref:Uncharacterized protein n=1 Tax=Rhizophora mucronata TaxID=61149 RepID=A0A2P2N829_RHIMU